MKRLAAILAMAAVAGLAVTTLAQTTTPPSVMYGKVVSVDATAGKVVVAPKEGPQVTFATDANTKVKVGGKDATLADLKPDMAIRVSPATGTAADIQAFVPKATPATQPAADGLFGVVDSVDAANSKVVIARTGGEKVTVTTDANTKFRIDAKDATLADLKPDMHIAVKPATGTATNVAAYTPKAPAK